MRSPTSSSSPTRMKGREDIVRYFAEMGFKKGAEVGVFEAAFSKSLLEGIPGLNMLCVDNWSTNTGWGIIKNLAAFSKAVKFLSAYPNATILKGGSVEVAQIIIDESLDFVYIDADHSYDAVKADIKAWAPKVRNGGVVAGHDYFKARTLRVIEAVDEYAKEHGIGVIATEWDSDNPLRDNRQPNWYFIKS